MYAVILSHPRRAEKMRVGSPMGLGLIVQSKAARSHSSPTTQILHDGHDS